MFLLDLRSKPCLLRSLKPIPVEGFGFCNYKHLMVLANTNTYFFFPGLILFPFFSSITYINFTVSRTHSFSTIVVSTVSLRQFVGK